MLWLFKNNYRAVIRKEEFFDAKAFRRMKSYFSNYEYREERWSDMFNQDLSVLDFSLTPLYMPSNTDSSTWKEIGEINTYTGGLYYFEVNAGIKKIGVRAFGYNLNLKHVSLPESLEVIEKEAFIMCCRLKEIYLPKNVRYIGKNAFDTQLTRLTLLSEIPPKISVLGIGNYCHIFVPQQSFGLYSNDSRWQRYLKQMNCLPDFENAVR